MGEGKREGLESIERFEASTLSPTTGDGTLTRTVPADYAAATLVLLPPSEEAR
jgi:hypothetical protein